ncbi:hypothetical protein BKA82DRAFT_1004606 [Pisolithus tinctorius]|uniref:Uncharacterized protein n=1 Tax=Pisolithus tinctorius Marx 270 TaxID=870435 RepID=A0A0C3NWE0_PISTI|nr:hypothetical protein BKA82DRAFT_1004606 [Pisolithus tinctorius]KIN99503.1 hypothetical protein M404DRAFT_1004606 [Pisolithus tinctorius Marx 270]
MIKAYCPTIAAPDQNPISAVIHAGAIRGLATVNENAFAGAQPDVGVSISLQNRVAQ